jgi:rhodanese-related sulfurtransferase
MHEAAEPVAPSGPAEGQRGTDQAPEMRLIQAAELKKMLDGRQNFKLVNALGDWEFRAKHIPGSVHFATADEALRALDTSDEIVVYCSNPSCRASVLMYRELELHGYRNLRRFAGGVAAWEEAGYPLEGEWTD